MNNIINEIVGGRYYVLELLGEGGTSNVFKAMDIHTKEICALKRYITSDPANNKTLLEGMERELSVLKHCTHPVLPKIYNLIKEQEDFYLVMEYVEGIDLKSYVETNGTLKKREIKNIMEQICSGLYYLHSLEPPVIYRDLKPSNVILTDERKIKLIDFGIAKRYSRDIVDEIPVGSKGFAAPEQYGINGRSIYNTDIRTDIYTIGTTMYYLKTKKKYDRNKKTWRVHGKLKKIIRKCTEILPDKRYQSCIDVLCDIKSLHIIEK